MEEKPKILVGAPTSKMHDYIIDRYIENLNKFTYPNFDVLLVDTSEEEDWLRTRIFNNLNGKLGITREKPTKNIFETLTNARNGIIKYFLSNGYDYLLMIDTDTLPPSNTIEKLLSHNKHIVGFLTHGGTKENKNEKPIVLKSGNLVAGGIRGLDYYSWEEIEQMNGKLTKVWATSVGCLLVKREVFEAGVKFRYTPYFNAGEDVWFFLEANSAGFEFWLDPFRVIHENRYWKKIEESLKIVKKIQQSKVTKAELNNRVKRMELLMADLIRKLKENKII